ncbi:hypothetical protein [Oceanicoccus sp. KOV_DT_Chl]|uniref:hypothetical protein n=1 Tax=Oceanicoccus sp. KOV_DT_Chl TaxID=1904639 RepID=UPI000C7C55AD|nr:hypothetical protein [Oceanicoccus sp. KOV_DT_Chl]
MQYSIREWDNGKASLVAEDGHVLSTFDNTDDAIFACVKDCRTVPLFIASHYCYLGSSPMDWESQFLAA